MRRAIVTGVSGLIGRELSLQLTRNGAEVHGLTRQPRARFDGVAAGVHLHQLDGRTESLTALMKEVSPDVVFHLAGAVRRKHAAADVVPLVEANVLFGTQLLESMRASGCRRIITAGSYLQHADTGQYRALNLYAATKQAFESVLEYYADAHELCAARLTCCNVYSENDTSASLMADIARAWGGSQPLVLREREIWLDLVHVEDVAAAFIQMAAALEHGRYANPGLCRFSITSGHDVSATELLETFERVGGRKVPVNMAHAKAEHRRTKPWRGVRVDGWQPRITLDEGIARIIATHVQAHHRTRQPNAAALKRA